MMSRTALISTTTVGTTAAGYTRRAYLIDHRAPRAWRSWAHCSRGSSVVDTARGSAEEYLIRYMLLLGLPLNMRVVPLIPARRMRVPHHSSFARTVRRFRPKTVPPYEALGPFPP